MTQSDAADWERARQALGSEPALTLPGFFARAMAFLIDATVIVLMVFLLDMALGFVLLVLAASDVIPAVDQALSWVSPAPEVFDSPVVVGIQTAALGLAIAYLPWFWARGGQTPGMAFLRMRVVRSDTEGEPGFRRAIVRFLALAVSIVSVLGILWAFVDPKRRGWHDIVAGTVVIAES